MPAQLRSYANLCGVGKTPVCVLGLGLIGGSVLRAAVAAGREALGYNRSADGVAAARSDGFTATADLTEALAWASARQALIVVAVPMPAVGWLLDHIKQIAPDCPITDVISVKNPVLQQVRSAGLLKRYVGGHPMAGTAHSGWPAGNATLFQGAPWVVAVDDHDQVFVVEQNRDAQMRSLLVNEFDLDPARLIPILHYEGTPITARYIARAIAQRLPQQPQLQAQERTA